MHGVGVELHKRHCAVNRNNADTIMRSELGVHGGRLTRCIDVRVYADINYLVKRYS